MSTPPRHKRPRPSCSQYQEEPVPSITSLQSLPSCIYQASVLPMASLPGLPEITGDIIMETFTHRSLRFDSVNPDSEEDCLHQDNQRLIELGDKALQLSVTNFLFHKKPFCKSLNIPVCISLKLSMLRSLIISSLAQKVERDKVLCTQNIRRWVDGYKLRPRLRYLHSEDIDIRSIEVSTFRFAGIPVFTPLHQLCIFLNPGN